MSAKIIDEFTHIPSSNKRWKLRHPEQVKKSDFERRIRYEKKNPLKAMLKRVKARAKKFNIEFAITTDDLKIPEYCPVLGTKLERSSTQSWWPHSPSVDRIDNNKGYLPGNVAVISWRANSLKSNATIEELERVIYYMKEHLHCVA